MSQVGEDQPTTVADVPASTEPRLEEETETKLATEPHSSNAESHEPPSTEGEQTYTEMATSAATSAAATATAAATGVKDSVFSMFGGGGAKEKRVEKEDDAAKNEPSGSSKAVKEKEAEEDVCLPIQICYLRAKNCARHFIA
jgi:Ran-binding protein 1